MLRYNLRAGEGLVGDPDGLWVRLPDVEEQIEQLTRERNEARQLLAEAATRIECGGSVAHRIDMLKEQHAHELSEAVANYERMRKSDQAQMERAIKAETRVKELQEAGEELLEALERQCGGGLQQKGIGKLDEQVGKKLIANLWSHARMVVRGA